MINSIHYIELYINGQHVELEAQDSLNLRINNVLFNPTKTSTQQAEYSYSFSVPATPNNNRIFGYADNLSKINKFHARYPAQVYADGELLFDGSLTLQKYSAKDKMYECNLVNIKVNSIEDIFGDDVMTDMKWMVNFSGASSINEVNADYSSKYYFPLVSYGAFQKKPSYTDEVGSEYTPKHNLDKYNKWWVESFYPSLNMMETIKKCFENKKYSNNKPFVVGGTAFSDPNINNIYCSPNLASEQTPIYNLGNQKFGDLQMNVRWNNFASKEIRTNVATGSTGAIEQDLKFPYYKIRPASNAINNTNGIEYNFDKISIWNMCDSTNNSAVTVTLDSPSYMYDPNEMVVVVPADGWYRINMAVTAELSGTTSDTFVAPQWTNTFYEDDEFKKRDVTIHPTFKEFTPLEVQLVKNYDGNIELIKGKKNVKYESGDPNQETFHYEGGSYTSATYVNKTEWITEFPHQDLCSNETPTKTDNLLVTTSERGGAVFSRGGRYITDQNSYGYRHRDGELMPYDQAVSTAFICGVSTLSDGTMSVQRNGRSWSKLSSVNNKIFADVEGLDLIKKVRQLGTDGRWYWAESAVTTDYCENEYKNSSNFITVNDTRMDAMVQCCVYLNKNDVLELMAIQRDYEGQKYATTASCYVHITALSERTEQELRADPYWQYNYITEFPKQLNLFNFTNSEMKVSDWINNIQKAFNLDIVQDGNKIDINTNKGIKKTITNAISIDDRVNSDEVESEYISYPKEMSVQYKIDTDEWGYELTVPPEHINDDDWADWGDSGYTIIKLNDDSYETTTQNTTTNFSYTYYDNFIWKEVLQDGTETENSGVTISIPVLSKSEYMVEGYDYEESMKHDGYSLTQRFWYRDQVSQEYVWLSDFMHEQVYLTYPKNVWDGFYLSYKDTEKSIVSEYFNVSPMLSSNYVNLEVYLTPNEYKQIKGGVMIHFDSDLYLISEVNGYDPSGNNPTELKLIKKTI